jgi:hypothetical protein
MGAESFGELREEVSALDVNARLQRLRDNEARRRALEADDALVLASLKRDKAYQADGHATMFGLLRATLGWSERECRMHTQIARLVEAVPSAGEALFEAWVPVANIATIARLHANPHCREQLDRSIGTLLRDAERAEHDDFNRDARRWRLRHDPVAQRKHRNAHTNRGAWFRIGSHAGGLNARWSSYDADRNREVFDRQFEAEFEADWARTVELYGDQASAALMPRTAAQRAADAITAIFQRAASTPPGSKPPKPVGNIHLDWHTFCDLMVEHKLFPERSVDPFEDPTPIVSRLRCETGDGVLVDRDTVMRTLLEGFVRFVVLDDKGVPIRWGRERRLFTGAAREAVLALSPRCTHPGCRVRAGRCQIDHLTEWHQGGETCPDNGGIGCGRHNRMKHRRGYTVTRDRLGIWHTLRPDGTEIG